jgi:hypothetical protein
MPANAYLPAVMPTFVQAKNSSGPTIPAGSGVVITGTSFGAPVPGAAETAVPAFSFALPTSTVTIGSLGIVRDRDIVGGDIGLVATAGSVVAARSDGTGTTFSPLTITTSGALTVASSGSEVIAHGLAASTGSAIWCRVVEPYVL